ncbi:MAG: nucleoside triphosphate pyrophosphohydrolase [Hyphomicrobiaceae bacterium]
MSASEHAQNLADRLRLRPALGDAEQKTIEDLLAVMVALRTPGTGCPWDLKQTFETIAPYTIEEAYEVADAIARGDLVDLEEELGDLLLQVVYHAQIASEQDAFDFTDVVTGITRKMLRRHPHVFGTQQERAAGVQPGFWEAIKADERAEKQVRRSALALTSTHASDRDEPRFSAPGAEVHSQLLEKVPVALPALTRALKLQQMAAKVGFDWPSLSPVLAKMREELAELDAELASGTSAERVTEEFGDLLFVMANVARHLAIDPEAALRAANEKFVRRFAAVERAITAGGGTLEQATLEDMEAHWTAAKRTEKANTT